MTEPTKRKLNVSGLRRAASLPEPTGASPAYSLEQPKVVPQAPVTATLSATSTVKRNDERINAYVDATVRRRTVNAIKRVGALEGVDSLSAAVEAGLLKLVEEFEDRHNGGKPFDDVDQQMPRGRRPR